MSMQLLKACSRCGEVIAQCVMSAGRRVRQGIEIMTRQVGTSSQLTCTTLRHGVM
ncbi:hypothetical protein SB775_06875 [Peribacillus sp. SIMBA_075]|uniref:hypothetical protein n=1 Tax=Peribacillus sp. SIMBA_075 TaxID=3085813 RepID=UPI00397C0113